MLLRFDDEPHWLRAAPKRIGHMFAQLLAQGEYNARLRQLAPLMEATLRWLADATPATAERPRLMDATPVPCGASAPTGLSLANPKLHGERDRARQTLERQPANRPAPGTAVVTDKGLAGQDTEDFFAGEDLHPTPIRPARKDEDRPRPFPNVTTAASRRPVGQDHPAVPGLNACIWHNRQIGAPVKRSLIAYDHI